MRIGLDVDGVLANFFRAYEDHIINATGKNLFGSQRYPAALPQVWDWPQTFGYTAAEISEVWKHIRANADFYRQLESLPGVLAARQLTSDRHDIYFITDRNGPNAQRETQIWLSLRGFRNPSVLLAKTGKGDIARALDLELYIDDKVENILDVQEKAPKCRSYLAPLYPYNINHPDFEKAHLISGSVEAVLHRENL